MSEGCAAEGQGGVRRAEWKTPWKAQTSSRRGRHWGAHHAVLAGVGGDVRISDVSSRRGGHRVKGEKTASLSSVFSR